MSAATTSFFFFFNDTATTEIYTLSLHDALPISHVVEDHLVLARQVEEAAVLVGDLCGGHGRSEEHTSELQSRPHLVCRLLLEKKKKKQSRRGALCLRQRSRLTASQRDQSTPRAR